MKKKTTTKPDESLIMGGLTNPHLHSPAYWKDLVDGLAKRFFEQFTRRTKRGSIVIPGLMDFVEQEGTAVVAEFIPLEFLKKVVLHYRLFDGIHKETQKCKVPKSSRNKITSELERIEKALWLTENEITEINELISSKMAQSPKGLLNMLKLTKTQLQRDGKPPNDPLDFLTVALVLHMKKSGKPRYRKIFEFLSEQEILQNFDEELVKKRFYDFSKSRNMAKHNKLVRLQARFTLLRLRFLKPLTLPDLDDLPPEYHNTFLEKVIPSFDSFLP